MIYKEAHIYDTSMHNQTASLNTHTHTSEFGNLKERQNYDHKWKIIPTIFTDLSQHSQIKPCFMC